jgi:hypothetical protein
MADRPDPPSPVQLIIILFTKTCQRISEIYSWIEAAAKKIHASIINPIFGAILAVLLTMFGPIGIYVGAILGWIFTFSWLNTVRALQKYPIFTRFMLSAIAPAVVWTGFGYLAFKATPHYPSTDEIADKVTVGVAKLLSKIETKTESNPKLPEPTKSEPAKPKAEQKLTESQRPPQLSLIFKNSPLFTPARKERIAKEMESFYRYLTEIGFDVPKDIPPLGTRPGNVISMTGSFPPDSIYVEQIRIPEQWLDKPNDIRNVYALWAFRKLFGLFDRNNQWQFTNATAELFSCYYRSSFANRNVCDNDWIGRNWNNILWDIRGKKGQNFTDRAMFYTYKLWRQPTKEPLQTESFDDFFYGCFKVGLSVIDNNGQDQRDVADIVRAHAH